MEDEINVYEINGVALFARQQKLKGLSDMCDILPEEVTELMEINKMVLALMADYKSKINTTAEINHPGQIFCKESTGNESVRENDFSSINLGQPMSGPIGSSQPAIFIDQKRLNQQ